MLIEKEYRFYAAHRNETLNDKCRNVHGHRYGIKCVFRVERRGSLTTLFSKFDEVVEPLLKNEYDHAMLIHAADPLLPYLRQYSRDTGDELRLKVLDAPSSVENLGFQLFTELTDRGLDLEHLEIRETDTSVVIYTREDWQQDLDAGIESRGGLRSSAPVEAPVSGVRVTPVRTEQPLA